MIFTEQDAKTKKCQETFNTNDTGDPCIASACMAWRWHLEKTGDFETMVRTDRGYCGKAGKP